MKGKNTFKKTNPFIDIIDLTLKDCKFYSPSTGELIWDAGKMGVNHNAKSLAGYWEFDSDNCWDYYECRFENNAERVYDIFHGIVIKHTHLFSCWEHHLHNCTHLKLTPEMDTGVDLENFIFDFDHDPNLICFRITNPEKPRDRMYFVLEMNGKVESPE